MLDRREFLAILTFTAKFEQIAPEANGINVSGAYGFAKMYVLMRSADRKCQTPWMVLAFHANILKS